MEQQKKRFNLKKDTWYIIVIVLLLAVVGFQSDKIGFISTSNMTCITHDLDFSTKDIELKE